MYVEFSQLLQQVSRSREGPLTEVSQMCERPGRLADLLHWPAPGAAWVPPGAAWVPPGCRLGAAWCRLGAAWVPPGAARCRLMPPGAAWYA